MDNIKTCYGVTKAGLREILLFITDIREVNLKIDDGIYLYPAFRIDPRRGINTTAFQIAGAGQELTDIQIDKIFSIFDVDTCYISEMTPYEGHSLPLGHANEGRKITSYIFIYRGKKKEILYEDAPEGIRP